MSALSLAAAASQVLQVAASVFLARLYSPVDFGVFAICSAVAGIASVLAMALGTAITVSALAILAVTAKNWAVAIAGDGRAGNRIHNVIEIGGALFIFLIGLTLLAATVGV